MDTERVHRAKSFKSALKGRSGAVVTNTAGDFGPRSGELRLGLYGHHLVR
jgi:hypothetical protein